MENKTQVTHPDSRPPWTHQAAQLPPAPTRSPHYRISWALGHCTEHTGHARAPGEVGLSGDRAAPQHLMPHASSPMTVPVSPSAQPLRKLSPGEACTAGPGQDARAQKVLLPASLFLPHGALCGQHLPPRMGKSRHLSSALTTWEPYKWPPHLWEPPVIHMLWRTDKGLNQLSQSFWPQGLVSRRQFFQSWPDVSDGEWL